MHLVLHIILLHNVLPHINYVPFTSQTSDRIDFKALTLSLTLSFILEYKLIKNERIIVNLQL